MSKLKRNQTETSYTPLRELRFGGPLLPQDATLRFKLGGLYENYNTIFRDINLCEAWRQFEANTLGRDLLAIPASETSADLEAAELIKNYFDAHPGIFKTLLTSEFYGWSLGSLYWEVTDDGLKLPYFQPLNQDDFIWIKSEKRIVDSNIPSDLSGFAELRDKYNPLTPLTGWGKHFITAKADVIISNGFNPYGRGLAEILYWWVRELKVGGLKAWSAHLNIHGLPPVKVTKESRVGEYTRPRNSDEIVDAIQFVMQQRGVLDLSDMPGIDAEFMNSPGDVNPNAMVEYIDKLVKMLINGPNLTSESGNVGSQALGNIHHKVSLKIYKSAADNVTTSLQRLIDWIVDENLPNATPPSIRFSFPEIDLTEEIERWETLDKIGIEPTNEKIENTLGSGYQRRVDRRPTEGRSPLSFSQHLDPIESPKKPWDVEAVDSAKKLPLMEDAIDFLRQELEAIAENNPGVSDDVLVTLALRRLDQILGQMPIGATADKLANLLIGSNLMGRFSLTS